MTFDWSDEKNKKLREERNISFEEIIIAINDDKVVEIIEHPNKEKYSGQQMYLIKYNNYIYVVPFIKKTVTEEIFLKTIFPSRFYTKKFLSGGNKNGK